MLASVIHLFLSLILWNIVEAGAVSDMGLVKPLHFRRLSPASICCSLHVKLLFAALMADTW